MKTLIRIMVILTVFSIVAGLVYVVVNAGSTSWADTPPLEGGAGNFRSLERGRPGFPGRAGEDAHEGRGAAGWIFSFTKNTAIIAIIVTLVALPKSLRRRRMTAAG